MKHWSKVSFVIILYELIKPFLHSNKNDKTFDQFTDKKKPADKTGIQHDNFKSETKEISKRLTSKDSQNLNGLKKYLSEIKNINMEEEYKVCLTSYKYPAYRIPIP